MKHVLLVLVLGNLLVKPALAQNWTLTSANTNLIWTSIACSADGSKVIAGAATGGVYLSTDSGHNWTQTIGPDTNANFGAVAASAEGKMLAALDFNLGLVYVSTNSGALWSSNYLSNAVWTNALLGVHFKPLVCSADGAKLFVTTPGNTIYASVDSGASWNQYPILGTNAQAIAASADGTKLVSAGFWNGIFRSTNAGATWQATAATNAGWWSISSSADGTRLTAGESGNIYISTDSGATWIPHDIGPNWIPDLACSGNGNQLVAIANIEVVSAFGSGGIITSPDSGTTWNSTLAPFSLWTSVASSADGSTLFATAYGALTRNGYEYGGIYTFQTNFSPVLNLTNQGNSLVVSWLAPSTDFYLMQSSNLDPNGWTYVYPQPKLNSTNLQLEVSIAATNDRCFYRLAPSSAQTGVQFVAFNPPLAVGTFNGEPHFGYIHFDFRSGTDGVILGWAYQTKPGTPIIAVPISDNLDQSQP
jgi:photosystem II stability/assembly factor-like uncharacterized protein